MVVRIITLLYTYNSIAQNEINKYICMYICAETTCLISIGACVGAKSNLANILIKQRSLMIHLIHLLYITMFLHLTHE